MDPELEAEYYGILAEVASVERDERLGRFEDEEIFEADEIERAELHAFHEEE
jgi:hypothetical protein